MGGVRGARRSTSSAASSAPIRTRLMVREFQTRHRRRGARTVARALRPSVRRRRGLRRRRQQRDLACSAAFVDDGYVRLVGRRGRRATACESPDTAATLGRGQRRASCTARARTSCRTATARSSRTHSVSAGLDYPGVGPEHAYLKDAGRVEYVSVADGAALEDVRGGSRAARASSQRWRARTRSRSLATSRASAATAASCSSTCRAAATRTFNR